MFPCFSSDLSVAHLLQLLEPPAGLLYAPILLGMGYSSSILSQVGLFM